MKLIELSKNRKSGKETHFAIVSDEDYDYLNQFRWSLTYNRARNKYAIRHDKSKKTKNGKYSGKIKLHREVLGLTDPKILCDHKDGNGLNCQRDNLRKATRAENARNRNANKNGTSKYIGVYLDKRSNKWIARINNNNNCIHLGCFINEIDAAKRYDIESVKYFGEFAHINIK